MKVAVYGSLKCGFHNHRVIDMAGGRLVGTGKTKDMYTMRSLGGFPGVFLNEPTSNISVEVYEVEDIRPLDALEGYPHFYDRTLVRIVYDNGEEEYVWMYFLHGNDSYYSTRPVVEDGVWL